MAEKASFSVRTKDELCRIYPEKECCRLAELAALVRLDGTVTIGLGGKPVFMWLRNILLLPGRSTAF